MKSTRYLTTAEKARNAQRSNTNAANARLAADRAKFRARHLTQTTGTYHGTAYDANGQLRVVSVPELDCQLTI